MIPRITWSEAGAERVEIVRPNGEVVAYVRADLTLSITDALVERAGKIVYDYPLSDGDALAVLIHCSDYVPSDIPLADQLAVVRSICCGIARAVLENAHE